MMLLGRMRWDIQRLLLVGYPAAASGGASSGSADLGGAQRPTIHGAIACHGVHASEEAQDEGAVPARRTPLLVHDLEHDLERDPIAAPSYG